MPIEFTSHPAYAANMISIFIEKLPWVALAAMVIWVPLITVVVRRRPGRPQCLIHPAVWLGAGAVALGVGAVLAGGAGVAHADAAAPDKAGANGGRTGPARGAPMAAAIGWPHRPGDATPPARSPLSRKDATAIGPQAFSPPTTAAHTVATPPRRITLNTVVRWVNHELRYTLFNRRPTMTPAQLPSDPDTGVVVGDLHTKGSGATAVTYSVTQPTNAQVLVNSDGTYTVTPGQDLAHYGGQTSFTVTADNGTAYRLRGHLGVLQSMIHALAQRLGLSGPDTATTVVTVTVAATNKPPLITGYTDEPPTDTGVVTGQVQATDANNDTIGYRGPTATVRGGAVVVSADGSFRYTPTAAMRHAAAADNAAAEVTTDSFTVTADDGYGGQASRTISVTVSPSNSAPIGGQLGSLQVDDVVGLVTGSVVGITDPDADPLTFSAGPSSTGGGSVEVGDGGTFTYLPTLEQRQLAAALGAPYTTTHDSFTLTVTDGHGGAQHVTVIVPVPPDNESPTGVAAG